MNDTTSHGLPFAHRTVSAATWSILLALLIACDVDPDLPPEPMIVDPPAPLCPDIAPASGPYAMKGACCYRTSNREKLRTSTTGKADIEFRMMSGQVLTQPRTVGSLPFLDYVQRSYDTNHTVSLIRIRDFPNTEPGDVVIESGPGRFNADGTYSLLDNAAPVNDLSDDTHRWDPIVVDAHYDPALPEAERFIPADTELAHRLVYSPEWRFSGGLEYELTQYSPRVLTMTLDADLNCIGERGDTTRWVGRDIIESFVPLEFASLARSTTTGWSLCTTFAFGFVAFGNRSCETSPRSTWVELPTGMCVDGRCYEGEATNDEAVCTTNPDIVSDALPICCDPLGEDTTLPECNAFRVQATYVAAAVEITDERISDGTPLPVDMN